MGHGRVGERMGREVRIGVVNIEMKDLLQVKLDCLG